MASPSLSITGGRDCNEGQKYLHYAKPFTYQFNTVDIF